MVQCMRVLPPWWRPAAAATAAAVVNLYSPSCCIAPHPPTPSTTTLPLIPTTHVIPGFWPGSGVSAVLPLRSLPLRTRARTHTSRNDVIPPATLFAAAAVAHPIPAVATTAVAATAVPVSTRPPRVATTHLPPWVCPWLWLRRPRLLWARLWPRLWHRLRGVAWLRLMRGRVQGPRRCLNNYRGTRPAAVRNRLRLLRRILHRHGERRSGRG